MFSHNVALFALSAFTLVSAQSDSNSTFKLPDPTTDEVTASERVDWCTGQQNACNTLCGTPVRNDCTLEDLNFVCECSGNSFPDMNLYMNTIPWYVCEELQSECIQQTVGDANAQKNCTETYADNCGTENVADHAGEGAATQSTTSSTTSTPTAASGSTSSPSSTSDSAAVPTHVHNIGSGAAMAAAGLFVYLL
ncbi:hypothetical protein F4778DRAFT_205186 [Xylariomycetidae sp. FL2044]|nr:hypothetical protein F4778DRAFT_205186 [Xylariomycetidae sp. FL2044]